MQLQICHTGEADGQQQFEVIRIADGMRTQPVALPSPDRADNEHGRTLLQDLRWYLEEYLRLPLGAYREQARQVEEALEAWGRACFRTLFSDRGRDLYRDARGAGLEGLRLKVSSNAPAVLAWPWEALCSDDDGFLAQRCCIERQLVDHSDPLPAGDLPGDRLNMLFVIARPYGERDVGYHALARRVVEYAAESGLPVTVDVLRPPTFDRLRQVLRERPGHYHIVHFDGHGGYGAGSPHTYGAVQGRLLFEDEAGGESPVEARDLAQLLAEFRIPVMVLNACQAGMIDERGDDVFASVAAALLKAGIRSVVAMGYSLYVSGAQQFVPAFYQSLLSGGSVGEAVRLGRQAMYAHPLRDCVFGKHPLRDWVVPVLYQQLCTEERIIPALRGGQGVERPALPTEAEDLGDYGFIGRERQVLRLERALRTQRQAGLLVHGMAGNGKTTLIKGFLHWLRDTGGLQEAPQWYSFEDIHSADYVINGLLVRLAGLDAAAAPAQERMRRLVDELRARPLLLVWDNFESVCGIDGTEVTPLLPAEDRQRLKELLQKLRGGKTKILLTSRSPEEWLTLQECHRLELGGLEGEETWAYCNAVVRDLGVEIPRDEVYKTLLEKLGGNPLAIRSILLGLRERSAGDLLAALETAFAGCAGDESTRRIQAAFRVLETGLDPRLAPVLRLVELHEHFLQTDMLGDMLPADVADGAALVGSCLGVLERMGFCRHVTGPVYQLHPALRGCLAGCHPASQEDERRFADVMGSLADQLAPLPYSRQRIMFKRHAANLHRAAGMAQRLGMSAHNMCLTQALGAFALNSRDFTQADRMFERLASIAREAGIPQGEASALHMLGRIAEERRDFDAAENWYKQSLEIEEKVGDEQSAAKTLHQLGILAQERRDFDAAEQWYKQALEKHENEHDMAGTLHNLGGIAQERRDYDAAENWYEQSLEIEEKLRDEHGAAKTLHQLGRIAQERRDFDAAEQRYKQSLEIEEKHENEHGMASTLHQLGRIAEERRDFDAAEQWYKQSLEIEEKLRDEHGAALSYGQLGILFSKAGNAPGAAAHYMEALRRFAVTNDNHHVVMTMLHYAQLLRSCDPTQQAALRRLWTEAGLDEELLNEIEGSLDNDEGDNG